MEAAAHTTDDVIYGGRVKIRQRARGYRVNVDTILLAASVCEPDLADVDAIVELGCGVGAGLLIAWHNHKKFAANARFVGIERDVEGAALAQDNILQNGAAPWVSVLQKDALAPGDDIGPFRHVFFNPPFDAPGKGRAPASERLHAHIADAPLEDWIKVWSNRMVSGAALTLIHRAQALPEILAALEGRLGGVLVFPVRPWAGAEAGRVLVRAFKGSRAPMRLLAGLDLHPEDGSAKHTPGAEAILRGEALLNLA